jgi:hypothetical protein
MHARGASQSIQNATRNAQDCEAICTQTIQYCLDVGGAHANASHIRLMQDCADVCAATTKVLLRGSSHHAELGAACASLCDACAASCEKYIGDAQLKACANQCLLCAAACRQMASSTAGIGEAGLRGASIPPAGFHAAGA